MVDTIRVELPLEARSNLLSKYQTVGQLRCGFPKLNFVKYIYTDPIDKKIKGANPPDNLSIVANAYITIMGEMKEVIKFTNEAVSK